MTLPPSSARRPSDISLGLTRCDRPAFRFCLLTVLSSQSGTMSTKFPEDILYKEKDDAAVPCLCVSGRRASCSGELRSVNA